MNQRLDLIGILDGPHEEYTAIEPMLFTTVQDGILTCLAQTRFQHPVYGLEEAIYALAILQYVAADHRGIAAHFEVGTSVPLAGLAWAKAHLVTFERADLAIEFEITVDEQDHPEHLMLHGSWSLRVPLTETEATLGALIRRMVNELCPKTLLSASILGLEYEAYGPG